MMLSMHKATMIPHGQFLFRRYVLQFVLNSIFRNNITIDTFIQEFSYEDFPHFLIVREGMARAHTEMLADYRNRLYYSCPLK